MSILSSIVLVGVLVLLWKKATTNEAFGILLVSLLIAIAGTLLKGEYTSNMNELGYFLLYWILCIIALIIALFIIESALNEGRKEFNEDKSDYNYLKNKENLTPIEKERFLYLDKKKDILAGKFKPMKIVDDTLDDYQ